VLKTFYRIVLATGGVLCLAACEPTNQGYAPAQPIQYSHAVHAGGLKIPCQYCHYAAERGRYAGIPPVTICMNCHNQVQKDHPEILKIKQAIAAGKPIEWVRIHRIPDHAYFNHSIHVRKGVLCQTCHGPVESMGRVEQYSPLTMGWCIECHRKSIPSGDGLAAASHPAPEAGGSRPAVRANRLTDCSVCHH